MKIRKINFRALATITSNRMSIQKELSCFYRTVSLTNRFHVAVGLFSNIITMTSKCGTNKKVAHKGTAECVTVTFWCHLWSITEQTQGHMESICFIQQRSKLLQLFYFKIFLNYSKTSLCPLWQTRKKAIWRNLLSIQNEAISLIAMRSKELWLVQKNHVTVKLDSNSFAWNENL